MLGSDSFTRQHLVFGALSTETNLVDNKGPVINYLLRAPANDSRDMTNRPPATHFSRTT